MIHEEHALDECRPVRRTLYSLNFILTAVAALVTYFNTSFLIARGVPVAAIGLVYMGAAVLSIVFLFLAPRAFSRFGNYESLLGLCGANVALLALLAVIPHPGTIVVLFVLSGAISTTLYLLLDMILDGSMPQEGSVGATRGVFLTISQVAWFVSPVVAGVIISIGAYELLYLVAAAMTVPAISIIRRQLKDIRRHTYQTPRLSTLFQFLLHDADMRGVFAAQLLLRIFFATMVIYVPLYLVQTLGISASSFGSIISFAMLAYLILEWPMGKLADLRFGEKEIMAGGFLIIAASTTLISLGAGTSILLWGGILFLTRIGAAMVDVTTESYFFKKADGDNTNVVSAFRILGPLSYILTPLISGALLLVMPLQYIFVGFAALMVLGIPAALSIKDTK